MGYYQVSRAAGGAQHPAWKLTRPLSACPSGWALSAQRPMRSQQHLAHAQRTGFGGFVCKSQRVLAALSVCECDHQSKSAGMVDIDNNDIDNQQNLVAMPPALLFAPPCAGVRCRSAPRAAPLQQAAFGAGRRRLVQQPGIRRSHANALVPMPFKRSWKHGSSDFVLTSFIASQSGGCDAQLRPSCRKRRLRGCRYFIS